MSDDIWAARLGDGLLHTSVFADVLGGVLEVAAMAVISTVAIAVAGAAITAATGLTIATGGLGCFVLGAVVGVVVGVAMNLTGADTGLSRLCDSIANSIFPPVIDAFITTGSTNTFTNKKPAARAAGKVPPPLTPEESVLADGVGDASSPPEDNSSFLDIAKNFVSQMWRPTVAMPAANAVPMPLDIVACSKHGPVPVFLAEGSEKVTINGQPAVRTGDRTTCEAKVGAAPGLISPNVRIGGGAVVVREIRSGKTPGVGLAISVLLALRGGGAKFFSKLPCMAMSMLAGAAFSTISAKVTGALSNAIRGTPNPVHAATGAKVLAGDDELDFVLPGLLPVEWQRFYSSRDERRDGLFGAGWSVGYEVRVEVAGDGTLHYIDEQARRIDMGVIEPNGAVFSAGEGLAVRQHADGNLVIESIDGLYRFFEPCPNEPSRLRLTQLGDRNDNRLYLVYDAQGRLRQILDSFDRVQIELTYSDIWPQRVSHIERVFANDPAERLVSYAYDAHGDLQTVREATDHVVRHFAYDAGRRMVEHQLPSGLRCFYQWAEYADAWRVIKHWTDAGDVYALEYDLERGLTRITDGLQRISTRRWNAQYQITDYTDNLNQHWVFEWDDERQLLGATDPLGHTWRFVYDGSGNLTETIDPLGQSRSTTWLPHWALPEIETDALGNAWQYRYDQRGNCIREIDPLGHSTRYVYDDHGQPLEVVDATGKHKKLRWNDHGQLLEHTDCSGSVTRFTYDRHGYLQQTTDALGEAQRYRYDAKGRLLVSELPDGRQEQFQHDASGQLIGYIDPTGNVTRYAYDQRGWVRQRFDAHNRRVSFDYDAYGRLTALTNENGESYRFGWDAGDRLVEQIDLDSSAKRYRYDRLDNVVELQCLPAANAAEAPILQQFQRDALGRLIRKITADGITGYTFSPVDQLLTIDFTDLVGQVQILNFAYDARGQLSQEQNLAGTLEHRYDELGNLIQTQLPDGRWLNRLYYGSGHLHQLNLDGQVISDFDRDRLHREVQRTQGQLSLHTRYDRCGRAQSRQRRLTHQPIQLPPQASVDYKFDASDNLIERRRDTGQTRYEMLGYDSTGRIVNLQQPGHGELLAYDQAANLIDGQQQNGGLVKHNRLLTYQDQRYTYDGFGRLSEKRSRAHGLQRFEYDAEQRLIAVHNDKDGRQNQLRMTYDPLGRRVAKTLIDSKGETLTHTDFAWDGLRLLGEQRQDGRTLYFYNEDNSYEPLARLDYNGYTENFYYYQNDLNGLPEQLTDTYGEPVWDATYQLWGHTQKETQLERFTTQQNLRYQGQYLDRETGLHYNTFRFYDPDIGRFTQPDPIGLAGGINLYQYAVNAIGWVDPLGLARCSLSENIVNDANKVASHGGHITPAQAAILKAHLPIVQRRNAFQNSVARKEFVRDQGYLMRQWENNTGRTWPAGATPHHIIPLESGGANKWWNLMPTNGALPNHSLPGIPGPHAAGGVLRTSIQQGRKALPPGTITDLRLPYD